jgi:hypothetical protein
MVVTGEFTQPSRSLEPKRFVQTFFLASQAPTGQTVSYVANVTSMYDNRGWCVVVGA